MSRKTPRRRRWLEQEVQALESQLRDSPEAGEEAGPDEVCGADEGAGPGAPSEGSPARPVSHGPARGGAEPAEPGDCKAGEGEP